MKTAYAEKLKHPLWQKKRLEIMERAGFTCEVCEDKESTLHVHHKYYQKGKNPWEYPDEDLECLCQHCHDAAHELRELSQDIMNELSHGDRRRLLGYLMGLRSPSLDPRTPLVVDNYETAAGLSDYYRLEPEVIIAQIEHDLIPIQILCDLSNPLNPHNPYA